MVSVSICETVECSVEEGWRRRERIDKWLGAEPQPGEEQIYVGKDYSLARLKLDIRAELFDLEESAAWPTASEW